MKRHDNNDTVGICLIWIIAGLMVSLFFLVCSEAQASRTMHLVDEYIDDGVKVCVYSDGKHYSYTERSRGSNCPYTHISYD